MRMFRRASDQESNSTLRYISGSRAFATLYENGVIPMNVDLLIENIEYSLFCAFQYTHKCQMNRECLFTIIQ